jgi:hypothetical protein
VRVGVEVVVTLGVSVAVRVTDTVHVAAAVSVAEDGRHPVNALATPSTAQLMDRPPEHTNAWQVSMGVIPNRMLTPVMISLMRTMPSPLQSPMHIWPSPMPV